MKNKSRFASSSLNAMGKYLIRIQSNDSAADANIHHLQLDMAFMGTQYPGVYTKKMLHSRVGIAYIY